jgi:hypothetical protein
MFGATFRAPVPTPLCVQPWPAAPAPAFASWRRPPGKGKTRRMGQRYPKNGRNMEKPWKSLHFHRILWIFNGMSLDLVIVIGFFAPLRMITDMVFQRMMVFMHGFIFFGEFTGPSLRARYAKR